MNQVVKRIIRDDYTPNEDEIALIRQEIATGWQTHQRFTHPRIAEWMVSLMSVFVRDAHWGRVLDPACGIAPFQLPANAIGELHGWEIDGRLVKVAQAISPTYTIAHQNSLDPHVWQRERGAFDFVIANPPFGIVRDVRFDAGSPLDSKSRCGAAEAFVELAYHLLKKNGIAVMLVPNGVLNNVSLLPFRAWLQRRVRIWGIVSLPSNAFYFAETRVKTSIIIFQKTTPLPDYPIFMSVIADMGWDNRGNATQSSQLADALAGFQDFVAQENNRSITNG